MNSYFLVVAILFPLIGGAFLPMVPWQTKRTQYIYIEGITILTSLLVLSLILWTPQESFRFANLAGPLEITFHMD